MLALWLENRSLGLRDDLPTPEPPPGEARIRVRLAGICGTDLELVRGYYPFAGVPGHEFVGVVESAPDAPQWVGRRVVGEINAVCEVCPTCRAGRRSHCERRTVLGIVGRHGAFAEQLVLPIANLLEVPETLSDAEAVFVEPAAAAFRVLEQIHLPPQARVLVVGPGRLGTLVASVLRQAGGAVTIAGRRPERLAVLEHQGFLTLPVTSLSERVYDVVADCTGNAEGLALACRAVRPGGTIVLKSTHYGPATLDLSEVIVDEITLVGSRCGPFAPALRALTAKRLPVVSLVEARYPLARAREAFEHAGRPGALKVLIEP